VIGAQDLLEPGPCVAPEAPVSVLDCGDLAEHGGVHLRELLDDLLNGGIHLPRRGIVAGAATRRFVGEHGAYSRYSRQSVGFMTWLPWLNVFDPSVNTQ
jgi:hypothetical protein